MKNLESFIIKKASGEAVHFSTDKLKRSLTRAGAPEHIIREILEELSARLFHGISTKRIYQIAFSLLKKGKKPVAARYKLKQGIMELGPSGFPFEKYIGEILKTKGYTVEVGVSIQGVCVQHEVDVFARKEAEVFIIECKYHNQSGIKCDVKTPLYVHSRFRDIESRLKHREEYKGCSFSGWLVTNTKFTGDAVKYGTCAGLKLIGWDFSRENSLRNMIEASGLYPLTCLTTLTRIEKQRLLDRKIVLCKELCSDETLLKAIDIHEPRLKKVMAEAQELCKGLRDEVMR
jgi:Holliday junction resolvase